jgi:DNA-binding Xre family transcriptional regulator
LAKAKGIHIGRPVGINQQNFEKVKIVLEKQMSVTEIVNLIGISISSVKRFKKTIQLIN